MSLRNMTCCLCLLISPFCQGQNILGNFFNGRSSYTLDFEYVQQFIVVSVKFQGFLHLNFIVDTGSEHTVMFDKSLTDLYDISYSKKIKIIGSDYRQNLNAYVARNVRLQLDGLPERNEDIIVLEQGFQSLSYLIGKRIDGIIGGSFFRNAILEFDYKKWDLIIHNANNFKKNITDYEEVSISIIKGKPYILTPCLFPNNVNDTLNLLIDSGASLGNLLYANKSTGIKVPTKHIPGRIGFGLGGELNGFLGRLENFEFATFTFPNMLSHFQIINPEDTLSSFHLRDGLIGNKVLQRFNVIIDYVHSKLYVKPNKNWDQSFALDRSGILVVAIGKHFSTYVIQEVLKNSPAYEAGIRAGDVIRKIGIWPASFYGLSGITRKLSSKAGKKIRIKVQRGEKKITYIFRLKDLI